jgi:hypothetical protein
MRLDDELYKFLLNESKLYRKMISTIWLQKFAILGAMVSFAAIRSELRPDPHLIGIAFLALPGIAFLLDVRIAACAINAKVIDNFIIDKYREPPVLGSWECTKWGVGSDTKDRDLVLLRSKSIAVSSVGPTCIIAFLSAAVGGNCIWAYVGALVFFGLYLLLARWFWRRLQRGRDAKSATN